MGGGVFVAAFKISFHFRCCPQAKTPITHVSDFCVSLWEFPWFTKFRTLLVQSTEFRAGRVWEGTASLSFFLEPEHIAPWHISVSTIQKFLWACVQRFLLKFYYPGTMCLIAVQITESSCLPHSHALSGCPEDWHSSRNSHIKWLDLGLDFVMPSPQVEGLKPFPSFRNF